MRALAHPLRIALLEAIMHEGSLTATRAAELLDDTPGNMSWHLQTLAKYGYIEEAGGGRGRARPWRVVDVTYKVEDAQEGDPEQAAAEDALVATLRETADRSYRAWLAQRRAYPAEWRKAAFSTYAVTYLTVEELQRLSEDFGKCLSPYMARGTDKAQRPAGSVQVQVVAFGHPLPSTAAGK